jgi:hypothetical protein
LAFFLDFSGSGLKSFAFPPVGMAKGLLLKSGA